jgi:hypothetical protein
MIMRAARQYYWRVDMQQGHFKRSELAMKADHQAHGAT